jgi:hypothetical protein
MHLNGLRWYFIDETGARCEKLFWRNERFLSRKACGLTYASQSRGKYATLYHRRDKAVSKFLHGTTVHGPPRGANKNRLEAKADQAQEMVDIICDAMGGQILAARERRRAQRHASTAALNAAKQYVTSPDTPDATAVVTTFTPLVDQMKGRRESPFSAWDPESLDITSSWADDGQDNPAEKEETPRTIELRMLQRLGYLKAGEILGAQICWSKEWTGNERRRLYFLIDLRDPGKPCAVFVRQYRAKVSSDFFWLEKTIGRFGLDEYAFICSGTGRKGQRVHFLAKSGFEIGA